MKKIICAICVGLFAFVFFAQETAQAAFVQACNAFRANDWISAQILLKKASAYKENDTEEVGYMLVSADMYAGDYAAALVDCDRFLNRFHDGRYAPHINYHRGRALFCSGKYNEAIMALSNFCHENPDHELYPSALYWIGESFYADYSYEDAARFYSRIVSDFPKSEKVSPAIYRIDTIGQREREEKLLYLLQQTGEEYLAAREEYERQLRTQNFGTVADAEMRRRLLELQVKNGELENKTGEMQEIINRLTEENMRYANSRSDYLEEILQLKLKAGQVQVLLDEHK